MSSNSFHLEMGWFLNRLGWFGWFGLGTFKRIFFPHKKITGEIFAKKTTVTYVSHSVDPPLLGRDCGI